MKVHSYLVLDECIQEEKKAISFQFIYRLHGEKTEHKINLNCCLKCRLSQSPFPLVSAGLVERLSSRTFVARFRSVHKRPSRLRRPRSRLVASLLHVKWNTTWALLYILQTSICPNSFNPNSDQKKNHKINKIHLGKTQWKHHRISPTDLKVRTTSYSVINSTSGKYCSVAFIWVVTP